MRDGWSKGPQALKATVLATRAAARVSTRAAGVMAARLWFTTWPVPLSDRARAHQAEWLRGAEELEFATSSGSIAGFAVGRGPAVLLVHGWGERAGDMGAFIEPLVGNGFRVVGIDLPAHGKNHGTQTNLLVAADAIGDVARQVDARAAIAHSMGAHAVVTAMSRGPSAGLDPDAVALLAPAVRLTGTVEKFGRLFALPPRAIEGLRGVIERRFGEDVWQDFAADRMAASLEIPALIVHDKDDPQIDVEDGRLLAEAWSGAVFAETSGLGHGRLLRDPAVIQRAVGFIGMHVLANADAEVGLPEELVEAGS
jgi:pimeloyl-ACP methyl ester carboxylesterase